MTTERVTEGGRSQCGIEMGEADLVVILPKTSVISLDCEGVDPIERLEVAKVRREDLRGKLDIRVEVDKSNILEAVFTQICSSFGEDSLDVVWGQA